ncbi:hypothetical protein WJX72_010072 [[Myrmecia] bisecta]|uniref:Uncharacterized protein n=1 Tax=[Myrmecia] bisecta TaxID=41462 RepID=A0AAW1Q4N6_9CHLO
MPGRDIRFRVPPGEANWGAATLLRAASIATTVVPEPPSPYLAGRRSWQPKGTSISLEAQAANQHASCYVGDARAASGSDHSAADPPDEQAQPCSAWPSQSAHAASHSPPDVHRSSPDTAAGANGLAATSRPAEPQAAQATPGMGTPEAILLDLQQASGQKSVWSRDPTARSGNAPLPEEQGPVAVGTVLQQREPQQHGTLDGAPKRRAAASAAQIERKFGKLLEEAEQLLARSNAARVVPKPAENAPAQRAEQPASKRMAFSRLDGRKNASFKGVRLRKQQQHEEWERQLSVRTGYWREGSGASPAELEAARLERQRRLWANTVALASRLEVLRQGVIQHRRAKHEWRVRKDAALRIASWYARVKLREYNKRMFKLTSVLKTYVVPWIRRARHETRLRSGAMILDFLQALHGRNSAVAAVNAFMGRVTRIQRMWRSILVIRQHQRLLLGLQLHRHEGQLLREKRRQASEFAGIGGSAATPKSGLHRRGSLTGAPDLPTRHNNRQSTPGSPESPARPNNRQSLAGSVESPARTTASPPLSPKPSASVQQLAWLAGGSSPASPRAGAARSGGLRSERELLARMTHRLPREAKAEAVSHAVQQACLAFGRALDAYHQHLRLYAAQKPIEEARLIVLQQAGMAKGHSELRPPQRPRMVVLLGRDALTALLMQCYNAIDARESARLLEEAQQREEERVVEAWASGRRPKLA